MTRISKHLPAALAISLAGILGAEEFGDELPRLQRLQQARPVIYNNDGCELVSKKPLTPERFLELRHRGLENTAVSTISYCTLTSGFSNTTAVTTVGNDMRDHATVGPTVRAFQTLGTDALSESIRFARKHRLESFWSMRVNDCHDAWTPPERPDSLLPPFKRLHPEYLVGTRDNPPPYGNWSAVDYGVPAVREMAVALIKEICDNYDIDGVDMDFCRHWLLFRSAARGEEVSRAECDALTEMMRTIRRNAAAAGVKRGRPIMIAVRVMDSPEACRAMGIDLARWCGDGLVDIIIGGSEVRLNQPDVWKRFAAGYPKIRAYITLTDAQLRGQHPLLRRNRSALNFRGQAAAAREAGLDGVYVYNEFFPRAGHARWLGEIHDPELLARLNKLYYFSHSYYPVGPLGKNWARFQKMPGVTPAAPLPLVSGKSVELELYVGRESPDAEYRLLLHTTGATPDRLTASCNGTPLKLAGTRSGLVEFTVPGGAVKPKRNLVTLTASGTATETLLSGDRPLDKQNQGAWRRLYADGFVKGESETNIDGSLRLNDDSREHFYNLVYPWMLTPGEGYSLSFSARVEHSDDPDAVMVRFSDGGHAEVLQLGTDTVGLKFSGKSAAFPAASSFHDYTVAVRDGVVTVSGDGKPLLSAPYEAPADTDARTILPPAAAHPEYLGVNCLMIGSTATTGTGAGCFRNIRLHSGRAGALHDGALLAIHDPDDETLRPLFGVPLLRALANKNRRRIAMLDTETVASWKKRRGTGKSNPVVSGSAIAFNNHGDATGALLEYPFPPLKGGIIEVRLRFRASDSNSPAACLQVVLTLSGKNNDRRRWSYQFSAASAVFASDQPSVPAPTADGMVEATILIDSDRTVGELYLNGAAQPTLINRPLEAAGSGGDYIAVGKGSRTITGNCELLKLEVAEYR